MRQMATDVKEIQKALKVTCNSLELNQRREIQSSGSCPLCSLHGSQRSKAMLC